MKRRLSPARHSIQSRRLAVALVVTLFVMNTYLSLCASAEADSPTSIDLLPGYFAPVSRMCCSGFDSMAAENEQHNCGSGLRICDEETFDVDWRDCAGLRRDTWYFVGYHVATIGILYAMPEGVSGWTTEQKEGYDMSIWWDNVTNTHVDSDEFYINYILHPYWGAAYYVRARERGYNDMESFWYAFLLSSAFEFGVEALFEEPSVQDIIVTPIGGALVGMYFMNVRDNIREREIGLGYRATKDKWLWVLTDPLGSLNRQMDKLFGWETKLQFRPYSSARSRNPKLLFEPAPWDEDRLYGIEFNLQW